MRLLLFTLQLLCSNGCYSQNLNNDSLRHYLIAGYDFSYIGNNIKINYSFSKGSNSYYIGLKYFDNNFITDTKSNRFKDRGHSFTLSQRIGLGLGFEKNLFEINDINTFLFFDAQSFYIGLRDDSYVRTGYTIVYGLESDTVDAYYFVKSSEPPAITLEMYSGVGIEYHISKRLVLSQKSGIGIGIYGHDDLLKIINSPTMPVLSSPTDNKNIAFPIFMYGICLKYTF